MAPKPAPFTVLCLTATVLLLTSRVDADVLFQVSVRNEINNQPVQIYNATARTGGSLFGAMTRLNQTNSDFTFSGSNNIDFGFFVESINDEAGNTSERTFWRILSDTNGTLTPTPVGVTCYIPKANEHIVFNFTRFGSVEGAESAAAPGPWATPVALLTCLLFSCLSLLL